MSAGKTGREGPFAGSRCLAGIGNIWSAATVRRVNEDNTFTIELDEKEMAIMPYWYGVTPAEISFNDRDRWPAVFDHLRGDESGMTAAGFARALLLLELDPGEEWIMQTWKTILTDLFDIASDEAAGMVLDIEQAYHLIQHAGFSAKEFVHRMDPEKSPPRFYKLYWNQTRMGGREPEEVDRPVTIKDAFLALGLATNQIDPEIVSRIEGFEREEEIALPGSLKSFLSRKGIIKAVLDSHPNSPELLPQYDFIWDLQRGAREEGVDGDYLITIMLPHQGNHTWAVAFDEGEPDGRVYVVWRGEKRGPYAITSPSVGMFFWDLAQTGLAWFQETKFKGGKPVRRSDIGLISATGSDA